MQGGYDSRDGYNYLRLRSSELMNGTNVGFPGRWVFQTNKVPGNEYQLSFLSPLHRYVYEYEPSMMH